MSFGALPIRVRLTAAFALAMAAVFAITAFFVYLRVQADLGHTIDSGLRSRADDVASLVSQTDSGLAQGGSSRLTRSEDSFAQVLNADGSVVDSTPGASRPALSPAELQSLTSPTILDNRQVSGIEGEARLLAEPVSAQDTQLVVVVGATVSDSDEALSGLIRGFVIGGPLAVILASGLGYLLAGIGLAPVEAIRRRAERVTMDQSGERLPLPKADDEIRRLGETLNAMLGRLEESFERERSFVADAGHELRAPLAVLKAELEVTLRAGGFNEEGANGLRIAIDEVDQLSRLADDLLLIARSENGRLPVRLERTDVRGLLEAVIERASAAASIDGRMIELEAPVGLVARLDPLRIRQAVRNLIDNALRYGAGTVTVAAARDGDQLTLSVADQGPGFEGDIRDRAFERFSRADAARGRGGTGLGLAIVRVIAAAHHGDARIEATSAGAVVSVILPVCVAR